jgi:hypothetical protein
MPVLLRPVSDESKWLREGRPKAEALGYLDAKARFVGQSVMVLGLRHFWRV